MFLSSKRFSKRVFWLCWVSFEIWPQPRSTEVSDLGWPWRSQCKGSRMYRVTPVTPKTTPGQAYTRRVHFWWLSDRHSWIDDVTGHWPDLTSIWPRGQKIGYSVGKNVPKFYEPASIRSRVIREKPLGGALYDPPLPLRVLKLQFQSLVTDTIRTKLRTPHMSNTFSRPSISKHKVQHYGVRRPGYAHLTPIGWASYPATG